MSSEFAIKVENLSKCYQIYEQPHNRLKQFFLPRIRRLIGLPPKQYYKEFWALKDVSFEVKNGETVGIIGRNGSGKSTLLQTICGTLNPTGGSIQTNGRIAALLELGSGFNPEFTGRENIYLNAKIFGLTDAEIDSRYSRIVSFSEISEFIDQPIKTYSSGMTMRLAFSVAIHVEPRILIVDEALAVGDFAFQEKCYKRIKEMKSMGVTILFVTHDVNALSAFCDEALLLSNGVLLSKGDVNRVVNEYKRILSGPVSKDFEDTVKAPLGSGLISLRKNSEFYQISKSLHRSGDGSATILDWFVAVNGVYEPVSTIEFGDICSIVIEFKCNKSNLSPNAGFYFSNEKGLEIAGSAINHEDVFIHHLSENDRLRVEFRFLVTLRPGVYFLNLGVSEHRDDNVTAYDRYYSLTEIHVLGKKIVMGHCSLMPKIEVKKI